MNTKFAVPWYAPIVREYFDFRLSKGEFDGERDHYYATAYGSIPVAFRIDPQTGVFQAATMLRADRDIDFRWQPRGRVFDGAPDQNSVREVLARLDAYVRLLVPDEVLTNHFEGPALPASMVGLRGDAAGAPMGVGELYDLVRGFFGPRLSLQHWSKSQYGDAVGVAGVLYGAVGFSAGFSTDSRELPVRDWSRASFGASLYLERITGWLDPFYGDDRSFHNGLENAKVQLAHVDLFAREWLGAKYIAGFEAAYGVFGPAGGTR